MVQEIETVRIRSQLRRSRLGRSVSGSRSVTILVSVVPDTAARDGLCQRHPPPEPVIGAGAGRAATSGGRR